MARTWFVSVLVIVTFAGAIGSSEALEPKKWQIAVFGGSAQLEGGSSESPYPGISVATEVEDGAAYGVNFAWAFHPYLTAELHAGLQDSRYWRRLWINTVTSEEPVTEYIAGGQDHFSLRIIAHPARMRFQPYVMAGYGVVARAGGSPKVFE